MKLKLNLKFTTSKRNNNILFVSIYIFNILEYNIKVLESCKGKKKGNGKGRRKDAAKGSKKRSASVGGLGLSFLKKKGNFKYVNSRISHWATFCRKYCNSETRSFVSATEKFAQVQSRKGET